MECIFCRIAAGEAPSDTLYRDEEVVAFRDINPRAPVHILVIPRRHIPTVANLAPDQAVLAGRLILVANELARREGIAERGYRLLIACGRGGGQVVPHMHLHLMGGY